jgi:arylsulfatase
LASTVHPPLSSWGNFAKDEWELFHLETDRSQSINVAADHPDLLEELKSLWFYYAGIYKGLPLDDRSALEQVLAERPRGGPVRDQYTFYPDCADVPESAGPAIPGRSYTIAAGVQVDSADAQGVIWAAGGVPGGHSLYIKDRRLRYTFNWIGTILQDVVAERDLTPGSHVLAAEFAANGPSGKPEMPGTQGTLTLFVDDQQVGQGQIITQPGYFCLTGDGICVGRDSASAVTPEYKAPFPFTGGSIDRVVVDLSGDKYVDHESQVRAWFGID